MVTADWIAIAILVVALGLGALLGLGKWLKFFTSGVFGIIISIVICYFIGGGILQLGFVQELLSKFASLWSNNGGFGYSLLTKIHLEIIVFYIVLFILVQIVRVLLVKIIQKGLEANVKPIKVVNRVLGAVFAFVIIFFLGMLVLWIVAWVGGDTASSWEAYFEHSGFLGALYRNNPIAGISDYIAKYFPNSTPEVEPETVVAALAAIF